MKQHYARPAPTGDGLRLHLNENTAGCSPKVLEALASLSATDLSFYPDYDAVYAETAAYLGVPDDRLLLLNGLDEGILLATIVTQQRRGEDGEPPESVVIQPTFDMYAITVRACGGPVVDVMPRRDFSFPREETIAAISPRTRLVFITSPNNPTGVRVSNDDIRAVAAALPAGGLVFVDEAYHDFCGDTSLPILDDSPNVIVGRTFAKAHGLAALRAGALIATPETMAALQRVAPPYNLNVAAAAALRAALKDRDHLAWYVSQVEQSRALVYRFCDRHGFEYWPSGANFVLFRIGDAAAAIAEQLRGQGIHIRNKSADPGCDGCLRITTGVVSHTEQCLAAMEELL
jgi:histidinol-phosphate aminotransferase